MQNIYINRRGLLVAGALVGATSAGRPALSATGGHFARGRRFSVIVAGSAGSGVDIAARFLCSALEAEFPGTSFQVVNRPGAGLQVGLQALADAPKDGYTFGLVSLPTAITVALDPARRAGFTRDSFLAVANFSYDAGAIAVRADGPYRTLGDLIEAAKRAPQERTVGVVGPRGREHLDVVALEGASGAAFTPVFHNDSSLALNTLLGGNIDAVQGSVGDFVSQSRAGRIRTLAVFDGEESAFAPGVPTAESLGFALRTGTSRGFAFPTGAPVAAATALGEAIGRIARAPERRARLAEMSIEARYMDQERYATYWTDETRRIGDLLARIP